MLSQALKYNIMLCHLILYGAVMATTVKECRISATQAGKLGQLNTPVITHKRCLEQRIYFLTAIKWYKIYPCIIHLERINSTIYIRIAFPTTFTSLLPTK